MNPQENRDYDRKLQELEAQIEQDRASNSVNTTAGQPLQRHASDSQLQSVLKQVTNWFTRLPTAGKVAVIVVAAIVGFSVLRTVFQLVASLISLAILGVILYLVYKFFVIPKS